MTDYLQHYGVLGMKWGIRRYQNKDGSLTSAGQKHYEKTGERGFVYKSHATKKYDRKAARAQANADKYRDRAIANHEQPFNKRNNKNTRKGLEYAIKADKYKARADRSRELDRRQENFARHENLGKHLALRFLTGGLYGGKTMMEFMSQAGDRRDPVAQVASTGSNYIGTWLGTPIGAYAFSKIQKARYIRGKQTAKVTRSMMGATDKAEDLGKRVYEKRTGKPYPNNR